MNRQHILESNTQKADGLHESARKEQYEKIG